MTCPQCNSTLNLLKVTTTDSNEKNIYECLDCGGHFLENYLVNFITTETARNVDSVIPKNHNQKNNELKCPTCGQNMFIIQDDQAIPQTVSVYNCPNSHGDFFPKDNLLLFKKAQDAKLSFHKLWGIPIKTAFSVIIPLFIVFTSVTVLPNLVKQINISKENRVKASELISNPLVTPISDTEVLISFSTTSSTSSSITFTQGFKQPYSVSTDKDTNHLIKIDNLKPKTTYIYHITIDPQGKNISTGDFTFSTP